MVYLLRPLRPLIWSSISSATISRGWARAEKARVSIEDGGRVCWRRPFGALGTGSGAASFTPWIGVNGVLVGATSILLISEASDASDGIGGGRPISAAR